jgi:hypothetical protein
MRFAQSFGKMKSFAAIKDELMGRREIDPATW